MVRQARALPNLSICSSDSEPDTVPDDPTIAPISYDDLLSKARANLVPARSANIYEKHFEHFDTWMVGKGLLSSATTGENLAAYLESSSDAWAASTLWSRFSEIKKVLIKNFGLSPDLGLPTAVLKAKSATHVPKQSKVCILLNWCTLYSCFFLLSSFEVFTRYDSMYNSDNVLITNWVLLHENCFSIFCYFKRYHLLCFQQKMHQLHHQLIFESYAI